MRTGKGQDREGGRERAKRVKSDATAETKRQLKQQARRWNEATTRTMNCLKRRTFSHLANTTHNYD